MKTKSDKLSVLLALGVVSLILLLQSNRPATQPNPESGAPLAAAGTKEESIFDQVVTKNRARLERPKPSPGPDPQEIAAAVRLYFRREQVKMELEIEQLRYGPRHWQTETGEKQLRELDQIRAARRSKLTAEMNAILGEMGHGEPGQQLALTPIFTVGHKGPNITFLSPDSRARFEELIAAQSPHDVVDNARLLESARAILTPSEMTQYLQWNAPEKALLRNQLVGFNPTEDEFNAIAQWPGFVNQGNSEPDKGDQAQLTLASQIGVQRLADLIRLRDPELQTAVHDLHRLGLPLDQAESLAAFRSQGTSEIQQVWSDLALPVPEKTERVRQLQQAYRTRIAAALDVYAAVSDETDLMP